MWCPPLRGEKMKGNIRSWKREAKQVLKGKYSKAIWAIIAVNILSMLGSNLVVSLFTGDTLIEQILTKVVSFTVSLILCVFTAGLSYMYLNMSREKAYSYRDLLYFFKNHPDRVIIAGFVMEIINEISFIPYYYEVYTRDFGIITTMEESIEYIEMVTVTTTLAMILNLLFTLPLMQVYYLQADNLELGGIEALKESARLMKGHKFKYILLELSFLPWIILAAIMMSAGILGVAFGISILTLLTVGSTIIIFWLMPYMKMTEVFFYRALIDDEDNYVHRENAPTKEEEIVSWSEWRKDDTFTEEPSEQNGDDHTEV